MRAAARLIRLIDDGDPSARDELAILYRHSGRAHIIGFTGSPGVGKSTLVDAIIVRFRKDGKSVGVLAVDPTSPFSGGAILGDRVRMQRHFLDEGVFIRSLATRGQFGGLTRSTADAIVVLDAMGKDVIIVETVGVGQDEVDIAQNAHTTVLVTIPGMGDDIQAIKAGLMEIGDIIVVNKADREGAAKAVREMRFMLHMSMERHLDSNWEQPIVETVANADRGIAELYEAILRHWDHLRDHSHQELQSVERSRIRKQVLDLLNENIMQRVMDEIDGASDLDDLVDQIRRRETDPYHVSVDLADHFLRRAKS
jgi:LAO/AO transport system kinase